MMKNVLTVATRGGDLALTQTETIIGLLKQRHPGLEIKINMITTSGDKDRRTELWKLKTTGFFTSQLEDALLAGQADFAVHSYKDLPTKPREGLATAAVCLRKFVEDCLITTQPGSSIERLPASAKVGTSSLRRIAQIKHIKPDIETTALRGNVPTRIRKLEQGQFDAIILARAGLERLSLQGKISAVLDPGDFVPAPAQGALAIQTRSEGDRTKELIAVLDDRQARTTTFAERHVLTVMQCGCHAPVGAHAKIQGDGLTLDAFISGLDGNTFLRRKITGPADQAEQLAETIANQLLDAGGKQILKELEQ
ncbi:MAG: hydroxymethylbilane synthase [Planctomycetota bacterium]|jgi:hydroxymethylbilane synthase